MFTPFLTRRPTITEEQIIVIAWFDGEPELWILDEPADIELLRAYYIAEWGNREIPFDVLAKFQG